MVEAWRLHKQPLYEVIPAGTQMHVFFLFTGSKMPTYQEVLPLVLRAINKLISLYQQPFAQLVVEAEKPISSDPLPPSSTDITSH
jgi:hypothetical protein